MRGGPGSVFYLKNIQTALPLKGGALLKVGWGRKATYGALGEVAERLNAAVLKTAVGASLPWVRIPPSPPMNVNRLPSPINKGSAGDCAFGQSGHLRPKRGQLNPKLSHGQLGHVLVNRKSVTRTRHHGDYSLPCGDRDLREFLRNWKSANARQVPPLPASERNVLRRGISEPASREPANQG
jgi:hypothetical protein